MFPTHLPLILISLIFPFDYVYFCFPEKKRNQVSSGRWTYPRYLWIYSASTSQLLYGDTVSWLIRKFTLASDHSCLNVHLWTLHCVLSYPANLNYVFLFFYFRLFRCPKISYSNVLTWPTQNKELPETGWRTEPTLENFLLVSLLSSDRLN